MLIVFASPSLGKTLVMLDTTNFLFDPILPTIQGGIGDTDPILIQQGFQQFFGLVHRV